MEGAPEAYWLVLFWICDQIYSRQQWLEFLLSMSWLPCWILLSRWQLLNGRFVHLLHIKSIFNFFNSCFLGVGGSKERGVLLLHEILLSGWQCEWKLVHALSWLCSNFCISNLFLLMWAAFSLADKTTEVPGHSCHCRLEWYLAVVLDSSRFLISLSISIL